MLPANVASGFCFFPDENIIPQMLIFHNSGDLINLVSDVSPKMIYM